MMKVTMEYIFLLEIGIMKGSRIFGFFNKKKDHIGRDQQENLLALCNQNFELFKTIPILAESAIDMLEKTKEKKSSDDQQEIRENLFGGNGFITRIVALLLNDMKNIPVDKNHRDTLSSKFSSLTQLNQKLLELEVSGKKFSSFSNFIGTLDSQGVNELIYCLKIIKVMLENSAETYNPEKFKPRVLDSLAIKKYTRDMEGFIKRCEIVYFLSDTSSSKKYLPSSLIQETYFQSTPCKKNDSENMIPIEFSSIKKLYEKSWLCAFIENFNKTIYPNVNDFLNQLFNNLDIHCFFTTPLDLSRTHQEKIEQELENLGCDPFKNHLHNFNIILELHRELEPIHRSILQLTQSVKVKNLLKLWVLLNDLKTKMIDFRFHHSYVEFYESYDKTHKTLNDFLGNINNIIRDNVQDINRKTIHQDIMNAYIKAIQAKCFGRDKFERDKFKLFIDMLLIGIKQFEGKASINQFIESIKAVRTTWFNILKSTDPDNRSGFANPARKLSDSYGHSKKLEVLLLSTLCDRDIDCLEKNGINKNGFFIAIQVTLIIQLALLLSKSSLDNKTEILRIFNSALSSPEIEMSVGQIEKDYMPQSLPKTCEWLLPNLLSNPSFNKNKSDPGLNKNKPELDDLNDQGNLKKRFSMNLSLRA